MSDRFIDTNILVYAYDLDERKKRAIALKLVEDGFIAGNSSVSVQVLQELLINLERKKVKRADAEQIVRDVAQWTVVENTVDLFLAALNERTRWGISFWDGLILAAAKESGASELFSEDLSHGQDYGGICVVNPFK
jgi:predicted nucleic acid-binding protein